MRAVLWALVISAALNLLAGWAWLDQRDTVATLRAEAIEWQATRGSRSGRVAWQFFCDLAARHGVSL